MNHFSPVLALGLSKDIQKCSGSRKLVILFIVSSCYCFRARGIVSVVCSIVLSKGSKPFMSDLTRAASRARFLFVNCDFFLILINKLILLLASSCYCFGARDIVSVVCSIFLSKGSKPFMWDLTRATTRPPCCWLPRLKLLWEHASLFEYSQFGFKFS